jgi:predicted NBD/HSP70 family sugar kinase
VTAWAVVGLDNGGSSNNATVLDADGNFLVDRLVETPSLVREGPRIAVQALVESLSNILEVTGVARDSIRAVGLDTPGPASADGVISSKGSTNFSEPEWRGFDVRTALEERIGIPVVYNNDANAAALYAHIAYFGAAAPNRSSVSMIVGTGLGGGVVEQGSIVRGAAGMAAELGHIQIPLDGLLEPGQPTPSCNCGLTGDAESFASLTGIEKNLLPYWLSRNSSAATASAAIRSLDASSSSRRSRSVGCARSPRTSPIRTPTSWAAVLSRQRRSFATGSSRP